MNPYAKLPETAFWKTAVANKSMFDISQLWSPKFPLKRDEKISTFGSCFAQHIGKALIKNQFSWLNTEPAPFGLSVRNCTRFNYNVFTCRTGNIYTTSLLKQWLEWSLQKKSIPSEYWQKDGRFFDPFRPNIEPNGFESKEEMIASRLQTIKSFQQSVMQSDVFIFTLGLTESWFHQEHSYEYPMCPGTVAGEFNARQHQFVNQKFGFIKRNLEEAIFMMKAVNANLRIILTVSPVPLTATNSGKHVLVATTDSKAILRTVASELTDEYDFVDYFPSYEIINSPPFRGTFFELNQRSVNQYGIDFVMNMFFQCLYEKYGYLYESLNQASSQKKSDLKKSKDEEVCEELILEAFKV